MSLVTSSLAGSTSKANEDWVGSGNGIYAVLDGATSRTETGCVHGVAWFAERLGDAILEFAGDDSISLSDALAQAILAVAGQHQECDLKHPGSPSAAVAVVRIREGIEYLVLGDITLVVNEGRAVKAISDQRVSATARAARDEADRFPIGAPEKQAALLRMKAGELAAKNHEGGYWIATSEPSGVPYALTGVLPLAGVRELAMFTDGAARIVDLFKAEAWPDVLRELQDEGGAASLIHQVRALEDSDPLGERWPRNKKSDDASILYLPLPS